MTEAVKAADGRGRACEREDVKREDVTHAPITPEPRSITRQDTARAGPQAPPAALAGGHTRGETPVPIPNTAVKPAGPMILPQRESRSPPALNKSPRPLKGR